MKYQNNLDIKIKKEFPFFNEHKLDRHIIHNLGSKMHTIECVKIGWQLLGYFDYWE
jgi:hypothetical protein